MNSNKDEKRRVEEHAAIANYNGLLVAKSATSYCGDLFRRYMKTGSVLELGPAEGVMTDLLFPYYEDYTVVDGADFFVKDILNRHPKIKGYSCLFEEFKPSVKYDNVILGHVLEHVDNPVEILKLTSNWLNDEGVIVAAVPNSHSIHRQAAVLMGMLESEKQLNERDILNGHRRVYDIEMLKADFIDAGLRIKESGGYWLKPESNAQIDKNWDINMIEAFMKLGEEYPNIAAEIYVIAEKF